MHALTAGRVKLGRPTQNHQPFSFQLSKNTKRQTHMQQGAGPRGEVENPRRTALRSERKPRQRIKPRPMLKFDPRSLDPWSTQPWNCPARTMTYFVSLAWHQKVPIRKWAGCKPSGISSSCLPFWARECLRFEAGTDAGSANRVWASAEDGLFKIAHHGNFQIHVQDSRPFPFLARPNADLRAERRKANKRPTTQAQRNATQLRQRRIGFKFGMNGRD